MVRIYFIRHGETDYNLKGIVQGGGIDSSLNETGKSQANAFFETYKHISFDALYASTLQRTHQTLAPWKSIGFDSFDKHHGLNELGWGIHEGTRPAADQNQIYKQIVNRWKSGDFEAKVPEGESPLEAWSRANEFLKDIPQKHQDQTLLICSHGRQLRVILSNLLNQDMRYMEEYSHKNTALTIINISKSGKTELELLNNTNHLL